jgi:hypothetical protein
MSQLRPVAPRDDSRGDRRFSMEESGFMRREAMTAAKPGVGLGPQHPN